MNGNIGESDFEWETQWFGWIGKRDPMLYWINVRGHCVFGCCLVLKEKNLYRYNWRHWRQKMWNFLLDNRDLINRFEKNKLRNYKCLFSAESFNVGMVFFLQMADCMVFTILYESKVGHLTLRSFLRYIYLASSAMLKKNF